MSKRELDRIGSEGYEAIRQGRRFLGIELKESYFQQAVLNLKAAMKETSNLFSGEADLSHKVTELSHANQK